MSSNVRWIVIVLALFVLLLTGLSLFHTPAYEVVYSSRWAVMPSEKGRTVVFCVLEIGNTGRRPQEDVKIHFTKTAMNHAILQPTAKNFGFSDRPVKVGTSGLRTTLALGRLEPGKRVTVNVLLSYSAFESAPAWDAAFRGIEPTRGKVKVGDPGLTAAGRGPVTVFANYLPF